jgi:hypothetical protein
MGSLWSLFLFIFFCKQGISLVIDHDLHKLVNYWITPIKNFWDRDLTPAFIPIENLASTSTLLVQMGRYNSTHGNCLFLARYHASNKSFSTQDDEYICSMIPSLHQRPTFVLTLFAHAIHSSNTITALGDDDFEFYIDVTDGCQINPTMNRFLSRPIFCACVPSKFNQYALPIADGHQQLAFLSELNETIPFRLLGFSREMVKIFTQKLPTHSYQNKSSLLIYRAQCTVTLNPIHGLPNLTPRKDLCNWLVHSNSTAHPELDMGFTKNHYATKFNFSPHCLADAVPKEKLQHFGNFLQIQLSFGFSLIQQVP